MPGVFIISLFLTVILSSCVTLSDPETSQVQHTKPFEVTQSSTIGQSFRSKRPNLNSITIYVNASSRSAIQFALFNNFSANEPLVSQNYTIPQGENQPVRFRFPPQDNSPNQYYYFEINATEGTLAILGSDVDQYSLGDAYINRNIFSGDLGFETTYDYEFSSLVKDSLGWIKYAGLLLPSGLMLFLPGTILLLVLVRKNVTAKIHHAAITMIISISIWQILVLWSSLFNIQWNSKVAHGILIFFLIIGSLIAYYRFKKGWKLTVHKPGQWVAFSIVFIAGWGIRMIMVRDLSTPAWVDSVHHGLIIRQILLEGVIPPDLTNYLPPQASYYHPGFHILEAIFIWLTGMDIPQSMLWSGQLLNALSALSVYLFTRLLTDDELSATLSGIIVMFVTPMPAYFASWGRYTHLLGLILLPIVLWSFKHYIQGNQSNTAYQSLVISILGLGGLIMTHYRVALFAIVLLLIYISLHIRTVPLKKIAVFIFVLGTGTVLITIPWIVPATKALIIPKAQSWRGAGLTLFHDFSWRFLLAGAGGYSLALAGLGIFIILRKNWRMAMTLILWISTLFFIANMPALSIPAPNFINSLSVEISLFLPIATLGGVTLSTLYKCIRYKLPQNYLHFFNGASLILGIALSLMAARQLIPLLNPITFLSREADLQSLEWIDQHIPEDETILINPTGWGYGLYQGNDGGYWISVQAGNPTFPPPVLYGVGDKAYVSAVNESTRSLINAVNDPNQLEQWMRDHQINYMYIGARGGLLSSAVLINSPKFTEIYTHQNTRLLRLSTP